MTVLDLALTVLCMLLNVLCVEYREGSAEGIGKGEPREGLKRAPAPARPEVYLPILHCYLG